MIKKTFREQFIECKRNRTCLEVDVTEHVASLVEIGLARYIIGYSHYMNFCDIFKKTCSSEVCKSWRK